MSAQAENVDQLVPLWHCTAPPLSAGVCKRDESFADSLQSDVLVIGAGVTGLSAALHLAELGAHVVVLERDEPGGGTSGCADGQIIAGLHQTPEALIEAYGAECGERVIEFSGKAPQLVFDLISRHDIDCDAERLGWIQATRSRRQLQKLEREAESWLRRGAPVRMLDRTEIARLLGTDAYAGGWVDARGGTIQPFAYARGLAQAATRAGAAIYSGVEAQHVERNGSTWSVVTNRGTCCAPNLVMAMNTRTARLQGSVRDFIGRTYLAAHSVQLATAPLSMQQLSVILPQRHGCGDTSHLRLRYFRLDHHGRFVIGGPGGLTAPHARSALSFRILAASARHMFPALGDTAFEFAWAARDSVTPDVLPHLYAPCEGLFCALGYNGRGLAIGTAIGKLLASLVAGATGALPFPLTPRSKLPLGLRSAIDFYSSRFLWGQRK